MPEDEDIKKIAESFARKNRDKIARRLTDSAVYKPDAAPSSIFMAGSPGAGKTEFSQALVSIFEHAIKGRVIRIDGDELRGILPGYTGGNSYLFQRAVSMIIEKIHDYVLHNGQTFILDGTFSSEVVAVKNIRRSLLKGRKVIVMYLYQKPEVAWKFTRDRELIEGRNIPKDAFIKHFLGAKETISKIRSSFGAEVTIFLVRKNFETHKVDDVVEITPDNQSIDEYLDRVYTKDNLESILYD
jgi:predicted ABC-type ATPase